MEKQVIRINLTQHEASPEQECTTLDDFLVTYIRDLLTFDDIPTFEDIEYRAKSLAGAAWQLGADEAMIGGAPYLMPSLVGWLLYYGITPVFSFSKRVSEEERLPDGSSRKVSVFKHLGFVRSDETWTGEKLIEKSDE